MSVAGRLRIARRIPEGAQQVRLERVGAVCDAAGTAEIRELRHLEPLKPAGVDAGEGLEIERHVECQAVIARATAHAHPDARELAADTYTPGASRRPSARMPNSPASSITARSSA